MRVVLDNGAYMPEKANKADAGYDLRTPKEYTVCAGHSCIIGTGVHIEIPNGYVGFLKSKSGLNVKYNLTSEGVIDSGYTGEIVVKIYNHGTQDYHFHKGDKITQIVFLPIGNFDLEQVDKLYETERGNNGFGSSGR
jgi:dUTP pyrophosphatase